MTPIPARPDPAAAVHTVLVGLGLGFALARFDPAPRAIDLRAPIQWWADVGTGPATMEVARVAALVVAGCLVATGVLALAACAGSGVAARWWPRWTPALLRRVMVPTLVAGLAGSCATAGAQDDRPGDRERATTEPGSSAGAGAAVPTLTDLGPAPVTADRAVVLADLGPADPAASHTAAPLAALTGVIETGRAGVAETGLIESGVTDAGAVDTWVVAAGDHLWSIAAETLRDRGVAADTRDVDDYWRRLIDVNRDAIGPDADLIHPGLVLVLPDEVAP